jgi:hypothetical protein
MSGLWITPDDLPDNLAASEFAVEACEAASFLLWGMSGRKFSGLTTVTEKYGKQLYEIESRIINLALSSTDLVGIRSSLPEFSGNLHNTIRFRGRPVVSVESVVAVSSGIAYDPASYSLENHSTLVFNTFITDEVEITYTYGQRPPAAGKMAARALATQFSLLWGGREDECELPARVVSVNRQNVSWVLLDNQDFISELRTGVYAVDLFLKTVNPDGARQRAKVFSPDVKRGRRKNPL